VDRRRPAIRRAIAGPVPGVDAREDAGNRFSHVSSDQAEKELPHPHPPVAFGFLKVKPEPCIDVV
jgi:hypothetical protein